MALSSISLLVLGFFLLSFAIAVVAVLAGIGGGVIYTPIMLAFTPVNSLVIRATGLKKIKLMGSVSGPVNITVLLIVFAGVVFLILRNQKAGGGNA